MWAADWDEPDCKNKVFKKDIKVYNALNSCVRISTTVERAECLGTCSTQLYGVCL